MALNAEWNVVTVDARASASTEEPMGSKEKFWCTNPDDGSEWLFKFARSSNGETRNEDWAEWLVHHLAELVGVPTALVRPATCEGRRGVVCKSVLSQNFAERLVHGNELLREADPDYEIKISRENPGYTVEAVRSALEHVHPPRESSDLEWMSGFDVWSGYLVLDAWVAGRDRHHENWAVIDRADGRALSPSFDHGNALGFQVSDSEAAKLVANAPRLERWAERGRSHHFAQKPTLVRLAREAISACNEDVGAYWLQRLQELPSEAIEKTIAVIPGDIMSDPSRRFVLSLLELNRRRLTDDD